MRDAFPLVIRQALASGVHRRHLPMTLVACRWKSSKREKKQVCGVCPKKPEKMNIVRAKSCEPCSFWQPLGPPIAVPVSEPIMFDAKCVNYIKECKPTKPDEKKCNPPKKKITKKLTCPLTE